MTQCSLKKCYHYLQSYNFLIIVTPIISDLTFGTSHILLAFSGSYSPATGYFLYKTVHKYVV